MALYKYTARNPQGQLVQGNMETSNQDAVIRSLRSQGLMVTSVTEELTKQKAGLFAKMTKSIKLDDLIIFTRQLSTMVGAGLPLIESLDVLSQQMDNAAFKAIITNVEKDVEAGSTLTSAIEKHPKVFSELYINMVKAGEASGMLDGILIQLAIYLEKAGALTRKVKGAMVYPAVVSSVAGIITIFIMVVIIPKFEKFYSGMGATLPLPTRILLFWSKLLAHNIHWLILAGIVGGYLLAKYVQTPEGKFKKDSLKLTLPIIGSLFRKVAVAKFTRTLSTLVRSGVNIITALEIVAKTAGNVVIEQAVIKTKMSIQEGESISAPLAQSGVFPTMVTRMIAVGERTGALEEMLQKIAVFYEEQVDTAVSALTSLIEPILIVGMGIVVGGIVICMYLPIFNLVNTLSK